MSTVQGFPLWRHETLEKHFFSAVSLSKLCVHVLLGPCEVACPPLSPLPLYCWSPWQRGGNVEPTSQLVAPSAFNLQGTWHPGEPASQSCAKPTWKQWWWRCTGDLVYKHLDLQMYWSSFSFFRIRTNDFIVRRKRFTLNLFRSWHSTVPLLVAGYENDCQV